MRFSKFIKMDIFLVLCIMALFTGCADDGDNHEGFENPLDQALVEPETWFWVDNESIISRDGSSSGYGVSFSRNSTKVLIFLPGGGACYDSLSCSRNDASYTEDDFFTEEDFNRFLFERDLSTNLFKDWNHVFLAYGSGDVYSGNSVNVDIPNTSITGQAFKGVNNFQVAMREYFDFLTENDINVTDVFLAGSSAGGYGVMANFDQMATYVSTLFPDVRYTLLNDSGLLIDDPYILSPCLIETWDDLFNIQVPVDFDTYISDTYDYEYVGIYEYLSRKYPDAVFGYYASDLDRFYREAYLPYSNNCNPEANDLIPLFDYAAGMITHKAYLRGLNNWTYYTPGNDNHTILSSSRYDQTFLDVKFTQWVSDLHNRQAQNVPDL